VNQTTIVPGKVNHFHCQAAGNFTTLVIGGKKKYIDGDIKFFHMNRKWSAWLACEQ